MSEQVCFIVKNVNAKGKQSAMLKVGGGEQPIIKH